MDKPHSVYSSEQWSCIEALFDEALDIPPERRAAFLDESCADTPAVRAEVKRLLTALDEAGEFLEQFDAAQAVALIDDTEPPVEVGQRIGAYEVMRELGRGGMGIVYLARDPRLDRLVALKVLPPYLHTDDEAKRRFTQEARAASALDHPNIATIYEIDETAEGQVYIAMAYYRGETLKARIMRGALPTQEALALTRQIAEALAAAHSKGIIHRDVKPANVVLTEEGVAKLVDFGIAKITGGAPTRPGATLGTIAYMSPEQTRGTAIDHRTDVWSLGVVLYEMLTGERPFRSEHDRTLIHAIRHDAPESLRPFRPEMSSSVVRIVARCLEKTPGRRYTNIEALLADLRTAEAGDVPGHRLWRKARWLAGAGVLVVALLAGLFWVDLGSGPRSNLSEATTVAARSRLAVLPFDDLSPDPDDAYFADGLAEELAIRLSKLNNLHVTAHTSVSTYGDADRDLATVGQTLDAETVLEGSVRKTGDHVRVVVQLVDTGSQEPLWSKEYEGALRTVFAMQDEIAKRVAEALQVQRETRAEKHLVQQRTESPEAYTAYLKGRYFWHKRDAASFRKARTHFQQALDADPTYAQAWAGLADTYTMLASVNALAPEQAMPLARAAAERALVLDDQLAEAHTALATILMDFYWEWERAGEHLREAVTVNPNYALAHHRYAEYLAITEQFDEAVAEARQAQTLDPLSLYAHANVGWVLYLAGRYEDAAAQLQKVIALNPDFGLAHLDLGLVYLQTGAFGRAIEMFETVRGLWGDHPATLGLLGYAYARTGRHVDAQHLFDEVQARPGSSFHEAILHIGLEEHERALEALEEAVDQGGGLTMYLGVEPLVAPLRSDPRFQALLAKMGLAET